MTALRHLLIATGNQGKCRELRDLLSDLPMALPSLKDFPAVKPVAETGNSFVENASLKAAGYAAQTKLMTLAEDSGLEVDALSGAPGVQSARFAGEEASDFDRVGALLAQLKEIDRSKRGARFVSAIVIADGRGEILNTSVATCEGKIAFASRGSGGFGYDPIFIPQGYDMTLAELEPNIKNRISHRGRAMRCVRLFLQDLTIASGAG